MDLDTYTCGKGSDFVTVHQKRKKGGGGQKKSSEEVLKETHQSEFWGQRACSAA